MKLCGHANYAEALLSCKHFGSNPMRDKTTAVVQVKTWSLLLPNGDSHHQEGEKQFAIPEAKCRGVLLHRWWSEDGRHHQIRKKRWQWQEDRLPSQALWWGGKTTSSHQSHHIVELLDNPPVTTAIPQSLLSTSKNRRGRRQQWAQNLERIDPCGCLGQA